MEGLVMAAQLIAALALLVIVHEFGHFIAARAFGIRVEKFYLFFDAGGFKFFNIRKGGTEYGIGWLPLGGYVKISGMIDESMDRDQMKKPPKPWEFRSRPSWQRLIVMVAGVVMNVILGIIIFSSMILFYNNHYISTNTVNKTGIYAYELGRKIGFRNGDKIISVSGDEVKRFQDVVSTDVLFGSNITVQRDGRLLNITVPDTLYKEAKKGYFYFISNENFPFIIDSVLDDSYADKAGLKKGDQVMSLNDSSLCCYGHFKEMMMQRDYDSIHIKVKRDDRIVNLNIGVDSTGKIGVFGQIPYKLSEYSFLSALKYGTSDAFSAIIVNAKGLFKIISGEEKFRESVRGPIGIAQIYGGVWQWQRFWAITGLLSMILAFVNILPIPALDGGHVLFLLIETVTRRRLPEKFLEVVQIIGMLIILALMIFIIGNDILNL